MKRLRVYDIRDNKEFDLIDVNLDRMFKHKAKITHMLDIKHCGRVYIESYDTEKRGG